jgi:recombination protein RecA
VAKAAGGLFTRKDIGDSSVARTRNIATIVEQIKSKDAKKPNKSDSHIEKLTLLPSPSTLLNCACSDSAFGAFSTGRMINLIGDSSSGKTLFALSCLAEAAGHEEFSNYRLIYDDVENALTFNIPYLFGDVLASKIEPPASDEDELPIPSETIEDFHCNINDALDEGHPFIYILDSFDALDADQDKEKVEDMRSARARGTKAKGSYSMAKPKKSSELMRNICSSLKKTESILVIISQTRDNISPMSFTPKTRSGGNALRFYAHHEIWLSMGQKIKSKERIIGVNVKAKVSKNKLTGKVREVGFQIFYDLGIDDVGSCIDFLVDEKIWPKTKQTINAKHFELNVSRAKLIEYIENKNKRDKLCKIVNRCWSEIEEELKLNRKIKYL